jgi:outer membrane lipoprotein-sorting protein
MKKLLIASLLCSLVANVLFAQVTDNKAKAILDGVTAKNKSYSSMYIEFTYRMVNKKDGIDESQKGKITLSGEKYHLEIQNQQIFCDGKTVWTWLKDAEEVQISEPNTDDDALNPANLFSIWEKGFRYKFIREEEQSGKIVQIIDLTPIKGKSYHRVRLIIDKAGKSLTQASIYEKNNTVYFYTVNTFQPNIKVTEASFTFNTKAYPNVEIIDMR